MNDLGAAKDVSIKIWGASDYNNLLSLKYILNTNFPVTSGPWASTCGDVIDYSRKPIWMLDGRQHQNS
jgi:hypothetical protein